MSKFWSGLARFFAVIFVFLFVVTMLAAILLYNVENRLLNAGTYKSVLIGQQVYTRVPRILAEQLTMSMVYNPCRENPFLCENPTPEFKECVIQVLGQARFDVLAPGKELPTGIEKDLIQPCMDQFLPQLTDNGEESGPPGFMKTLTVANWETILTILFPPNELRTMTEGVIDQSFSFLNGQQDTVAISFVELKRRIAGQSGMNATLELIRAQPFCSESETTEMINSIRNGTSSNVFCRPSEEKLQEVIPDLQSLLAATVARIPDERVILSPESGGNLNSQGPFKGGLSGAFRAARMVMRLSLEFPLGFLLIITFLAVRTPKSWLRWWGIPSFFAGLLTILVAVSSSLIFGKLWLTLLASRIPPNISLGLVEMVRGLAGAMVRKLTAGITIGGLLVGLVGLGLWIGSFFIRTRSDV